MCPLIGFARSVFFPLSAPNASTRDFRGYSFTFTRQRDHIASFVLVQADPAESDHIPPEWLLVASVVIAYPCMGELYHYPLRSSNALAPVPIPFQRYGMGAKRFDTMADFTRHGCFMVVRCKSCRHEAEIDSFAGRSHMRLLDYVSRLRCSMCGSRRVHWFGVPKDMRARTTR